MASANSTNGRTKQSFQDLFCSVDLTAEIHHVFTCLVVINIIVSFTAVLGNSLILTALRKETSIHPPSKLLFRCLATTDLLLGLASEPLAILYWISAINQHWSICYYAFLSLVITAYALCGMSLITLAAISVDRLFALTFGLSYKQIVTIKRAYATVTHFHGLFRRVRQVRTGHYAGCYYNNGTLPCCIRYLLHKDLLTPRWSTSYTSRCQPRCRTTESLTAS